MKQVLTLFAAALMIVAFSSCEKCATCTSVSDDPLTDGEELTDEVCGRGKDYNDQVDLYERTNWDCTEN